MNRFIAIALLLITTVSCAGVPSGGINATSIVSPQYQDVLVDVYSVDVINPLVSHNPVNAMFNMNSLHAVFSMCHAYSELGVEEHNSNAVADLALITRHHNAYTAAYVNYLSISSNDLLINGKTIPETINRFKNIIRNGYNDRTINIQFLNTTCINIIEVATEIDRELSTNGVTP